MEQTVIPKVWEEFMNIKSGLPFVAHSVERVLDSRYHLNEASSHEQFELVYVQRGEATFDISGTKVQVGKKNLLLIKPKQPHRLIVEEEKQCSLLVLKFYFKVPDKNSISPISLEDFVNYVGKQQFGAFITLGSNYKNEIVSALNRITAEMRNSREDSEFLCSLITMELFVWLSRALKSEWENSMKKHQEKLKEMLESARDFIDEKYMEDIGLNDIANYIYLSPSHFARVFKRMFGVSPIQYLLSVRINRSKELLEQTEMKIGDIALNVGFSAQQRYNEIFRKQMKMSPSEYRAKCKAMIMNQ